MTRKGIKVRFYGVGDVDTTNLTEDQLRKLEANGIATTGDGYIWINKEKIKDGDTIDFNKVVSHELTHQILGKDTEYQARYVEGTYGEHLQGIKNNGYLQDGQILDLMMSSLTDEDRARLNKYVDDDMEFKELTGDDRIDSKVSIDMNRGKVRTAKDLNKLGKYEEAYKKLDRTQEKLDRLKKKMTSNGNDLDGRVNPHDLAEYNKLSKEKGEILKKIEDIGNEEKEEQKARKRSPNKSIRNLSKEKENKLLKIIADSDDKTYGNIDKYYDLPINQRLVVLENLGRQWYAYKDDSGKKMSKQELNKRLNAYMSHSGQLVSDINLRGMGFDVAIELGQYQIYPSPSGAIHKTIFDYRNEIGKEKDIHFISTGETRKMKIMDYTRFKSGLEVMKVRDKSTGLIFVLPQGSTPDIGTWAKAKVKSLVIDKKFEMGNVPGDDDWFNNSFGHYQFSIANNLKSYVKTVENFYTVKNEFTKKMTLGLPVDKMMKNSGYNPSIYGIKASTLLSTDMKYVNDLKKGVNKLEKWEKETYLSGVPNTPKQYVDLRGYYEKAVADEKNRIKKMGYSEEDAKRMAARNIGTSSHSLGDGAGIYAGSYTPHSQVIGVDPAPRHVGPYTNGILIVNPKNGLLNETTKKDGVITSEFNPAVLPFGKRMFSIPGLKKAKDSVNMDSDKTITISTYEAPGQFYMKEKKAYDPHRASSIGEEAWFMIINAPIKEKNSKKDKK